MIDFANNPEVVGMDRNMRDPRSLLVMVAAGMTAFSWAQASPAQNGLAPAPATLPQIVAAVSVCLATDNAENKALVQITHAGWQEKHWVDHTGKAFMPIFHAFNTRDNNATIVETNGFCVISAPTSRNDSFERVKSRLDMIEDIGHADHDQPDRYAWFTRGKLILLAQRGTPASPMVVITVKTVPDSFRNLHPKP